MQTESKCILLTVFCISTACIYTCTFAVIMHILCFVILLDVYLSLNDDIIPNHGYVVNSDIGSTDDTSLICHTNRPATLSNNINAHSGGNWFAPDGATVDFSGIIMSQDSGETEVL